MPTSISGKGIVCVKWTVFVFNFLFFLTGCGLIGLGVWLNVARNDWVGISDYNYISIANMAIGAGVIIVIVAFLGCCGAITENKIMLLVFYIFLLVIFFLEVGAGVASYVWKDKVQNNLKKQMEDRIPERYYIEKGVKTAMNSLQREFDCCGVDGIDDWSQGVENVDIYVDQSCCITNTDHAFYTSDCKTEPWSEIVQQNATNVDYIKRFYHQGCFQSVKDFLKDNLWKMALIGLAFAGVQIIGMICAMLLYCVLCRNEYTAS